MHVLIKKMKTIGKQIFFVVPLWLLTIITSCTSENNSGDKQIKNRLIAENENSDAILKSEKEIDNKIEFRNFKNDLDSFVIKFNYSTTPFDLQTDTINSKSSNKDLWAYKRGIFNLINVNSINLLIQHHYFVPKTTKILRIYLLELQFKNPRESEYFFKKLDARKNFKADLGDGYFLNYGLTGTSDYVILSKATILWLNISCQYSKKDFDRLIDIFLNNSNLTRNGKAIRYYCQTGYE